MGFVVVVVVVATVVEDESFAGGLVTAPAQNSNQQNRDNSTWMKLDCDSVLCRGVNRNTSRFTNLHPECVYVCVGVCVYACPMDTKIVTPRMKQNRVAHTHIWLDSVVALGCRLLGSESLKVKSNKSKGKECMVVVGMGLT